MHDIDDFDERNYPRPEANDFSKLLSHALSRRQLLKAPLALGTLPFLLATGCNSTAGKTSEEATYNESAGAITAEPTLNFDEVPSNTADTITLPSGYNWRPLLSWADPINQLGRAFSDVEQFNLADQRLAMGDNNDGMEFFAVDDEHAVLAVNNEYVAAYLFYQNDSQPTAEEVEKTQTGMGVTLLALVKQNDQWQLDKQSALSRKVTAQSTLQLDGPAAAHALLQGVRDPSGTTSLGTWANCGCGRTPWNSYLTCEENFNGYYGTDNSDFSPSAEQNRYGLGATDWGLGWYRHQSRFDINANPIEANHMGWVVEIDPLDADATPVKHTALGRFKHENAEVVIASSGQLVVYMGDDESGEHLYKYVSDGAYNPDDEPSQRQLLQQGTLYAAKFNAANGELRGTGQWLALSVGENGLDASAGFPDQASICVHTRLAASHVGATTMDRPEWVAVNPLKAEAYCSLTNNKYRGVAPNAGGVETPVGGPNPRAANLYGQIVRWQPTNGDHSADTFDWDLFALAGNPVVHSGGLDAGSQNIHAGNMFTSPDGLAFDHRGRLWIQTDGNFKNSGDFAGMGNNQMLVANPDTGEIRRFMVGPLGCEVTGLCWSADNRSLFVGIQHPGDHNTGSHFPHGGNSQPRSTVVVITRDDGAEIAS